MKSITIELNETDLAVIWAALAQQHNELLRDKQTGTDTRKKIAQRQFDRTVDAFAKIEAAISANA